MNTLELFSLKGRTAIVTGASYGLGARFAKVIAEAGSNVVLAARSVDKLTGVAKEVESFGVQALAVGCDVTKSADVATMVAQAWEKFGRVDVLINNAGVIAEVGVMPERVTDEMFAQTIATNVSGLFSFCREVGARQLADGRGGAIVNIASIAGLGAQPYFPPAYQASKAAVINVTRNLAASWATSQYRIEYKLKTIEFGGKRDGSIQYDDRVNGYSIEGCKTQHPWGEGSDSPAWTGDASVPYCEWQDVREGPYGYNGFHFLAIVDFANPASRNNHFWHYRRKVLMDAFSQHPDRVGSGTGGRICNSNTNEYYDYRDSTFNTVNMWISGLPDWTPGPGGLAGSSQWFMTSCSGGVAEQQLSSAAELQPELMPNEFYTFAIERDTTGYTLEASGNFARVGQKTLRLHRPFIVDTVPIWHYNSAAREYDGRFNADLLQDDAFGSTTWPNQWPAGSAITVGGVSALWMAEALMPRRTDAAAGPEVAAREGRRAMAINEKTANALLLDTIRIEGDAELGLEAYLAAQARPLLDGGVAASGNVYHLREQNVPASALGDGIYFAAYQLAGDDPLAARSVEQPGDHGRWHRMGLTSYSKIADYGRPDPAGDAPDSIMIVISRPTDVGYDALYNEWYTDNHMIDVAKSPHFRSATRYRPVVQAAGILLAYLCIYEIEHPYSPELNAGLMHWLTETPDDFRQAMPVTSAGEGVLTLDIWGYCQRVWSGVAD